MTNKKPLDGISRATGRPYAGVVVVCTCQGRRTVLYGLRHVERIVKTQRSHDIGLIEVTAQDEAEMERLRAHYQRRLGPEK